MSRLHGDMDAAEEKAAGRTRVLATGDAFRQASRKWHVEAVDRCSKGVQAATSGDASDPHAVLPEKELPDEGEGEGQGWLGTGVLGKAGLRGSPRRSVSGKPGRRSMMGREGSLGGAGAVSLVQREAGDGIARKLSGGGGASRRVSSAGPGVGGGLQPHPEEE